MFMHLLLVDISFLFPQSLADEETPVYPPHVESTLLCASICMSVVIYYISKIWSKRMTESMNQSISDKGDCRTVPATPGLLKNYVPMQILVWLCT